MPDTIGINLSTEPLCDDVDVVVLEIFRHTRNERDPNSGCEQQADASKELSRCVVAVSSGVVIDNVAKDDGIQERKDLVDRREHQDQYNEKPILLEVSEKNSHISTGRIPLLTEEGNRLDRPSAFCCGFARNNGLRRCQSCDRHPIRGTAHIVESDLIKELDRGRIAAVLAADPDFEVRSGGPALFKAQPD